MPPRPARTAVSLLMQEARAIELLMAEADVAPERLQEYWSLSGDLIILVQDVEELQQERPDAPEDDPAMFTLKHRLREVISRLSDLSRPLD